MADTKISALTALTAAQLAAADLMVWVDTDTTTTKSMLASETIQLRWTPASSSGAASLDFHEDTDNGSNRARLIGPASTADVTLTLPSVTTTLIGADVNGASLENVGAIESQINSVAATGSTETLDTSLYAWHKCVMDQSCTFTFSNPAPSGDGTAFILELSGAFTPTFPTLKWPDGAAATYTTPSVYVFWTNDAGSTWRAKQVGKAFA